MYVYICVHSCYCGMCRLCLRPNCDNFGFVALSFPNDKFVCPEPINSFCGNSDCLTVWQSVSLSACLAMLLCSLCISTISQQFAEACRKDVSTFSSQQQLANFLSFCEQHFLQFWAGKLPDEASKLTAHNYNILFATTARKKLEKLRSRKVSLEN